MDKKLTGDTQGRKIQNYPPIQPILWGPKDLRTPDRSLVFWDSGFSGPFGAERTPAGPTHLCNSPRPRCTGRGRSLPASHTRQRPPGCCGQQCPWEKDTETGVRWSTCFRQTARQMARRAKSVLAGGPGLGAESGSFCLSFPAPPSPRAGAWAGPSTHQALCGHLPSPCLMCPHCDTCVGPLGFIPYTFLPIRCPPPGTLHLADSPRRTLTTRLVTVTVPSLCSAMGLCGLWSWLRAAGLGASSDGAAGWPGPAACFPRHKS